MLLAMTACGGSSGTTTAQGASEAAVQTTETEEKADDAAQQAAAEAEETKEEPSDQQSTEAGEAAPAEQQGTEDAEPAAEAASTPEEGQGKNDVLVIYFSRTGEQYNVGVIDKGNTAIVAEMIAEETGADMFEVLPEEDYYPYTYDELTDIAKKEQNEKARPAYQGGVPDLSNYSTVFIGAPVWWGDWPMIMYTFFENEDLSGKILVPFSTHEGSGLSGFDKKLAAAVPDAEVKDGLAIQGGDAQNAQENVREKVKEWIAGLGL